MNHTVTVNLGERSYPIHIGPGLIANSQLFHQSIEARQVLVVTNETIAPLYLDSIRAHFDGHEFHQVILSDGEDHKTLASFEHIVSAMLERNFDRSSCVVALGGGVVGDLAGFASACYQRGVRYVQVPTTLLAQVDSSVGGKTAVNHTLGKNMIGAFHQPSSVIADTDVLQSLPDRDLRAGIAEVIKYGLIRDAEFFAWLETHVDALLARDPEILTQAISRSCENKAAIVAADERESGVRAILNLGHTFGHAIEQAVGYGRWLHGEAVAAGICMAASMSARIGLIPSADVTRIEALIARAGLPVAAPDGIGPATYLEVMARDKKNLAGRIRLVLLERLGAACVTSDYDEVALHETLASHGSGRSTQA